MVLQDRDVAILRGLLESRVMTAKHIAALFFNGRDEAAKKRLQKLKAASLIATRPRKTFEPAVNCLARNGIEALVARGVLAEYPEISLSALIKRSNVSDATIVHELAVMDVKVALCAAIHGTPTVSVAEFSTWPMASQFTVHGELQKPDGYIQLRVPNGDGTTSRHHFFLEVDLSTEPQKTLGAKAARYRAYYTSGGFALRHGSPRAVFTDHPFRVLFVVPTDKRRTNTAETLLRLKPPLLTLVWITTLAEIMANPLGAIWVRPVDFRGPAAGVPARRRLFEESIFGEPDEGRN